MGIFKRKTRWPRIQFKNTASAVAFLAVVASVVVAFWYNSQRQMELILAKKYTTIDQTNSLSKDQEKVLQEYRKAFYKAYGIQLILAIVPGKVEDHPQPETGGIPYLAVILSPEEKAVRFAMAPLVETALTREWLQELSKTTLLPLIQEARWPEALNKTLNSLTAKMDSLVSTPPQQKKDLIFELK